VPKAVAHPLLDLNFAEERLNTFKRLTASKRGAKILAENDEGCANGKLVL
jgi:hypothetical protein